MAKLSDDHIRWILDMDAKGVQSELTKLSSQSRQFIDDNKRMAAEIKSAEIQMKDAEKTMDKLTKAGKRDSDAFREAEKTFHSAAEEITSYKQRIQENTRSIEANNRVHNEMVRTMRIEDMTMSQLEQRAKSLEKQLRNTSDAAEPEAYAALSSELTVVRNRMGELHSGSQSMFSVFKGGLAVLAGNLMTQSLDKVKEWVNDAKEFVKEGIKMANSAEGVDAAFNKLNNSKYHLAEMRKATKETISDLKLMEKTVRADEMGIGIQNMANLMKFAQQQAKKMKTDVDYMANSIVDGLGRKSTMILDNLGISANQVQQEVKKTGDFTAAVLKIVTEKLKEQGDEALTGAEKAAQSAAKWENAQLKVGQSFKWLGDTWETISSNMADGIAKMAGETRTANEVFDDQLERVAKLHVETDPLIDRYEELSKKVKLNYDQTKDLNPEQEELLSIINQIKDAIPGVVTEFDKYGRAIGINTEKAREFIRTQVAMLKYMNKDAIDETQDNIDKYTTKIELLKKAKERGGYNFTVGGSNVSPGTQVYNNYTPEQLGEIENNLSQLEQLRTGAQERLKQINGQALEDQVKNNEARIRQQGEFNNMTKVQLDAWIKNEKNANNEYFQLARDTYKSKFGGSGDNKPKGSGSTPEQSQRSALNELNKDLEITYQKDLARIKEEYRKGDIKSEADYKRKLFASDESNYTLRKNTLEGFLKTPLDKKVRSDVEKEIAVLETKRLDQEIKFQAELEKIILNANPKEKEIRAYEERLSALDLFGLEKEKMTADQLQAFELLEKQHQENLDKIDQEAQTRKKAKSEQEFEDDFKDRREEMQLELNSLMQQSASISGSEAFEAEMMVHLQRLKMINEEVEARTKAGLDIKKLLVQQGKEEAALTKTLHKEYMGRYKTYSQYANSLGNALGSVLSGQEDAMKAFGNSLTDIFFDIVSKIVETKIMEATAVAVSEQAKAAAIAAASPDSVMSFGATSIARTAAISALIMGGLQAARATLKGIISGKGATSKPTSGTSTQRSERIVSGFAQGGFHQGYTGNGDKYEVKGFFPDGQPYHAGEYIIPQEILRMPSIAPIVRQIEQVRKTYSSANPLPEGFAQGGYHSLTGEVNDRMDPQILKELIDVMKEIRDKDLAINYYQFENAKKKVDNARNLGKRK